MVDGPINGVTFTGCVEQFLVPTLAPGDIVVMENLGSHKGQKVRAAIRKAGAKLFFLSPYSPDLNPTPATQLRPGFVGAAITRDQTTAALGLA